MARTNIDIDEKLIRRAMARYGLSTKREAVDFALHRVVVEPLTREEMLAMRGTGWHGDDELIWGTQAIAEGLSVPDERTQR